MVTISSKPVTELQRIIPDGEILLEYYYRDKDLYAFILSSEKLQAVKLTGDNLVEDIIAFRESFGKTNTADFTDISRKLYRRLFQPIEHALNKQSLIIVPHGALYYLPINALYDGKNYLIDRYSISMMPSANALKYLSGKKSVNKACILAFGNPYLGNPSYDLKYAPKEAIDVAKIYPNSNVFLKKEATGKMFRKYSSSYKYIHSIMSSKWHSSKANWLIGGLLIC